MVPGEGKMISISDGKLVGVKSCGLYLPFEWYKGIFYLPLIEKLKETYPFYLFGREDIYKLKKYLKKTHIFPLPDRAGFRERIQLKRKLPHPQLLIILGDLPHFHLKIINPDITIGSNGSFTITLNGDTGFQNLTRLLGIHVNPPEKTKKRIKGLHIPGIELEGFKTIRGEEDLNSIGKFYSVPSELAGKAYLMGLRVTLLVSDKLPLLPPDVKQLLYSGDPSIILSEE